MTAIPVNNPKQEYTKTLILALLVARKGGCSLKQLDSDYYEQEGEYIPWRAFGFVSLYNFLESIPETVRISNKNGIIHITGIPSNKSKHVSKLVSEQKCDPKYNSKARKTFRPSHYYPYVAPPKTYMPADLLTKIIDLVHTNPDGVSKDYLLFVIQSQMPCVNVTLKDIEDHLYQLSHVVTVRYNKVFPIKNMQGHTNNNNFSTNLDNIKPQVPNPQSNVQTIKYCAGGSEDSDGYTDFETERDFHFVPRSTEVKRNVVVKQPICNFVQESVSKCQSEEKYYAPIYKSVEQNKNGCWQFMDNKNNLTVNFDNILQDNENNQDAEILINNRTKVRLENLIQQYPDGIWCAELPEKYLEEYKISLNYMELGFNSVREFASHLPDIFHFVQPNETSDFILYYAKNDTPTAIKHAKPKNANNPDLRKNYDSGDETDPLPASVSVNTCRGLIPDNVMTIGECVGQLNVETLLNLDKPYVEVFVVEVFTPSFFWIQLRKKIKKFKKFMDEFHKFYSENNKDYIVPSVVLEKGLNCACKYNDIWHRGIIKSVKPDLRVTVMFYDYGTLKTYPPDEVCYLDKRFSDLPAQAIACGLVNTKPINSRKWTRGVTHEFAVRACEIPLVATIASINSEDNSMLVTLTDTLEDEDIHINDWLVERNLAVYGKMGDSVDMSSLMQYIEENLLFSPEKCYATENTTTDKDMNVEKLSEEAAEKPATPNVPLISPQSTLGNIPFRPPPGLPLASVPVTLEGILSETSPKSDIQTVQTVPKMPDVPTLISKKQNTNPFLEDDVTNNNYGSNLTPQQFMQLWTQNLQLQMQLSTTINTLLLKMMNTSIKNAKNDDTWKTFNQEEVLQTISNTLQTNFNSPNPGNIFDSNSQLLMNSSTSPFNNSVATSNEVATNIIEFLTTKISQPLSSPNIYSESKNMSDLSKHKATNYDLLNSESTSLDSSHCNTNSVQPNLFESTMGQDTLNNWAFTNYDRAPNELIDCSTPIESNSKIYKSDYHPSFNKMDEFEETNPFKLSLAGKLKITESNDDVQNDKELLMSCTSPRNNLLTTAVDHTSNDLDNRTNYSVNTDLYKNSFSPNVDENITNFFKPDLSSTKHFHNVDHTSEKIPATKQDIKEEHPSHSSDYGWSLDTINNRFSKIVIQAPPVMYNTNQETSKIRRNKNYLDSRNFNERFHDKINGTQQDTLSSQYEEYQRQIKELSAPEDFTLSKNPTAIGYELSSAIKSNIKQGNAENCKFSYENESPLISNNVQYGSSCFSSKLGSSVNSHVSYDYSKPESTNASNNFTMNSWSPLTGFTSPVFIDNSNADEGYITRPSTSHTSESSSPPIQQTGATRTSVVNGPYNNMSKNLWNKPVTQTFNYQNRATCNSDVEQQCDLGLQNSCSWNVVEREKPELINNFDDMKLRILYTLSDPDSSTFRETIHGIVTSLPIRDKILFQTIALAKEVIHLFYYRGDGWILTDEFVRTFTEFKSSSSMRSWFSKLNANIFLTEIEKSVYLPDITEEDRASLKIPRDAGNTIYNIHLMPLKSVLKVLKKLGVVTREDIDNAIVNKQFVCGSITHQIWMLINTYGQFIESHESS